ncbi:hypothetical protein DOY81_008578, partial [Sarcophaga bullata]
FICLKVNMKFLITIFFILSVSSVALASESVGYFKNSAYPGKCVYDGLILSPGEKAKLPNQCAQFLCGSGSFGTIQTCGVMMPPPGCKYTDYIEYQCSPSHILNAVKRKWFVEHELS